jgi:hypothetical protein
MALVVLALVAATVGALRSTWSPCGLSMLSSMTPLAERARGHRFGATVAWYVAGAIAGGATIGAAAAGLAAVVDAAGVPAAGLAAAVGLAALACAAHDVELGGFRLPRHSRQVDDRWFTAYRRWVYASGFGWLIGTGLATYITTACVYLTVAAAVATGDPLAAFAVCTWFGAVRGLSILAAAPLRELPAVQSLHARLDRWSAPSIAITASAQVALAAAAFAVAGAPLVSAGVVLIALAAATLSERGAVDGRGVRQLPPI